MPGCGITRIRAMHVAMPHLQALIHIATNAGKVELQKVDGVPAMDSPLKTILRESGFSATHRSLVAYGARPS